MNERERKATEWMQDLPAVNVVKEGTRVTLTMQPIRRETLCRTYWGSHGCSLDVREPHEVHQCGTEGSAYGVCSQMQPADGDKGRVRFWMSDIHGENWHWGDWSDEWTWFV